MKSAYSILLLDCSLRQATEAMPRILADRGGPKKPTPKPKPINGA